MHYRARIVVLISTMKKEVGYEHRVGRFLIFYVTHLHLKLVSCLTPGGNRKDWKEIVHYKASLILSGNITLHLENYTCAFGKFLNKIINMKAP